MDYSVRQTGSDCAVQSHSERYIQNSLSIFSSIEKIQMHRTVKVCITDKNNKHLWQMPAEPPAFYETVLIMVRPYGCRDLSLRVR
jgi:hypothetical protein